MINKFCYIFLQLDNNMAEKWIKCNEMTFHMKYVKTIQTNKHNTVIVLSNTEVGAGYGITKLSGGSGYGGGSAGAYDTKYTVTGCMVMKNFHDMFEKHISESIVVKKK